MSFPAQQSNLVKIECGSGEHVRSKKYFTTDTCNEITIRLYQTPQNTDSPFLIASGRGRTATRSWTVSVGFQRTFTRHSMTSGGFPNGPRQNPSESDGFRQFAPRIFQSPMITENNAINSPICEHLPIRQLIKRFLLFINRLIDLINAKLSDFTKVPKTRISHL